MKISFLLTLLTILCSTVLFADGMSENSVNKNTNKEEVSANVEAPSSSIDIEAGKKLYKKTCKNCHGPTAKGMASFPKLVDKEVAYLMERLAQYRAGEQLGPNTPLMAPQAVKLSDEDIANISHYIAALNQ